MQYVNWKSYKFRLYYVVNSGNQLNGYPGHISNKAKPPPYYLRTDQQIPSMLIHFQKIFFELCKERFARSPLSNQGCHQQNRLSAGKGEVRIKLSPIHNCWLSPSGLFSSNYSHSTCTLLDSFPFNLSPFGLCQALIFSSDQSDYMQA